MGFTYNPTYSPSQRCGAPFQALARGEGTISARLFTPGERDALAKSKVHQRSRAWVTNRGWWVVILTDLKNMAVCQEWDKQDFNSQKHIFGKSRFKQWALKQFLFEEMRRIDLLWKIVEYGASLLWMFNVYEFCCFNLLRKTCTAFLFNEAVLKFAKLPCLI